MGPIITKFVYNTIEEALNYSSYYADLLNSFENEYDSVISLDGDKYTLEFTVYGTATRRKNSTGNSKGTRYLPKSSTEDN